MGPSPPRRPPPLVDPFRLLFDAHAPFVSRIARSAGVPYADVPDVVQRVFIELHRGIGRGVDVSAPLRGWLRTVTYRTARDHLKLASNEREVVAETEIVDTADTAPNPEERMQAINVERLVNKVLDAMPRDLRIVLAMSDIDEMPMSEIAAVLDVPIGTGYSRLRTARRAFEVAWSEQRASSNAAVLPFMMWGTADLLRAARPTPNLSAEVVEEAWRGLVRALGSSAVGAGGAGAAVGAAAATAGKAGAVLTAKQAVAGAFVSVLVGGGLHALLRPALTTQQAPPERVASARHEGAMVPAPATATVSAAAAATGSAVIAPSPAPSAVATAAGAVVPESDVAERKWLESARDALERGDVQAARAALARVRSPRFGRERDELRRLLHAYQDGGSG